MRIAVAGIGYVGLTNAMLLAHRHDVATVDIAPDEVGTLYSSGSSPIDDAETTHFLAAQHATLDSDSVHRCAELSIIATPTNHDALETNHFDAKGKALHDNLEPALTCDHICNIQVIHHLADFRQETHITLANHAANETTHIAGKSYTRDLYLHSGS